MPPTNERPTNEAAQRRPTLARVLPAELDPVSTDEPAPEGPPRLRRRPIRGASG